MKSCDTCSIHWLSAYGCICNLLSPTSILRTSSTILIRFFIRCDWRYIAFIGRYCVSSAESDFNIRLSVNGVRSSWLILIRKRTFSSYTCCSCSFIAHFSFSSLRFNVLRKVSMTAAVMNTAQLMINHHVRYQGGKIVSSSTSWLGIQLPSLAVQEAMIL